MRKRLALIILVLSIFLVDPLNIPIHNTVENSNTLSDLDKEWLYPTPEKETIITGRSARSMPATFWSDDFSDGSKVAHMDNVILREGNATVNTSWWDRSWQYRIPVIVEEHDDIERRDMNVELNITEALYDNRDLSGSWHFNEGGGKAIPDSSGTGKDGIVQGGQWGEGIAGGGVHISSGGKVLIPGKSSLGVMGQFTLEAWVNGTGRDFSSSKMTSTAVNREDISFQVVSDRIYCVWREWEAGKFQIRTGSMYTNGTGWSAT